MPLQNRVLPTGEIVAIPERGTLMGNRGGPLHDIEKNLTARRWVTKRWICCELAFQNRRRSVMTPGRYTELFFLDEATALAAGHRPCFECRRAEAQCFQTHWQAAHGRNGGRSVANIDTILHAERTAGDGSRHRCTLRELPLAAMYLDPHTGATRLCLDEMTLLWTPSGYAAPAPRPARGLQFVEALTPPCLLAVLASGYVPRLHPSTAEIA